MKENARQGFWDGSLPPIGYRVVAADERGPKVKKKPEIDPLHADTVRLIYRLALEGDGTSGPVGVKNIMDHLDRSKIILVAEPGANRITARVDPQRPDAWTREPFHTQLRQ